MRTGGLLLRSVRLRLTLWNIGVLALTLVALGGLLRYVLASSLAGAVDRDMLRQAQRPPPPGQPPPPDDAGPPAPPFGAPRPNAPGRAADGFHPRFFDRNGVTLPPNPAEPPWDVASLRQAAVGEAVFTTITDGTQPLRLLSSPLRRDGQIIGVRQDIRPLAPIQQEVSRLTRILLLLLPLALVVAGLGGAFLTDRALRPVRRITQAASRIEAAHLSGRLPVTGDDEFAELAATFNAMLARLEAAFEQQRRFTADASHELRTPLTIIKAQSSLARTSRWSESDYRRAMETIDQTADRMGRLVQDLLLLARTDAQQAGFARAPVSLCDILEQASAGQTPADGPALSLDGVDAGLRVHGDADALVRVFGNLLSNAVRHTPADGQITVAASLAGNMVTVTVTDTGAGIAPEHLPHLFERFYRADASRARRQGGTGLGLAISKSIVESHGGTISIQSAVGRGTTIRVLLPHA